MVKVLDLCVVDEDNNIRYEEEKDLFEYEIQPEDEDNLLSGWDAYLSTLRGGSLDRVPFNDEDVDRDVSVVDDGGELIKLKDGRYINICWRGDMCRVWEEEDEEKIEYLNSQLAKNN